ncbi:MAG: DUF3488 domain-containing transglutaminase family protein [Deltaproteobacteria bacterium]|nr:DUF3488 domain-containing transglutaminase family protein [Deltaproteobacteria bacterium]
MNRQIGIEKTLKILTWAAALTGFLSVFPYVGPFYDLGFAVLCLVALYDDFAQRLEIPRWMLNGTAVVMVILGFFRMQSGNIVTPGIEVLLILVAIKFLEKRRVRDYMQIYALTLFLLAGSSLHSLDMIFLVYLIGFLFLLTLAIIILAYYSEDPALVLDLETIGKIFGKALLIPLLVLPTTAFLFVILPRASYPMFNFLNRGVVGTSGFTDNVKLGAVSQIQEDESIVLRAGMERVEDRTLYWRGIVFHAFDGQSWSRLNQAEGQKPAPGTLKGRTVRYTVYLEPFENKAIFTLDRPVWVGLRNAIMTDDQCYALPQPLTRRIRYNGFSALAEILPDPEPDRSVYLRLPEGIEKIERLVDRLTAGRDAWTDVSAMTSFFRSGEYRYSLRNLPLSRKPLEDFLFVHKYGNCEYFASALAVMLRVAGIPSRVVGGYVGGYYNETGRYYAVPQRNAHLWVEAYIDNQGWVRLDPTPALFANYTSPTERGFFFALRIALDSIEYYWNLFVINYDLQTQFNLFAGLRSALRKPLTKGLPDYRRLAAPAASLLILSALIFLSYILLFKRSPREERLLKIFQRRMEKRGHLRPNGRGLEEFVSELPDEALRERAGRFVRAFEEIFYRDRKMTGRDASALRKLLKEI